MSKRMSRKNQRLIYWFIDCYAYYLKGVDINWRHSNQKPPISDYFLYKAKENLKKLYIRHSEKNVKNYQPFKNLEEKLKDRIGDVIDKSYSRQSKINIITNDLMDFITEEIQMLFIKLEGTFSLSLRLMSNLEAISFTNYLFDYFLQNDIDMWEEMQMLYKQQNEEKYIYAKLRHKRCAVCNRQPVEMHHWKSAGSLGGYSKDRGQGQYISLCSQHHSEFHNIGVDSFQKKYDVKGIELEPEQIRELKKIYKNHFKGFKNGYYDGLIEKK